MFLFCALRYDVGWDYTSYVSDFENGYLAVLNGRYEPLSTVIMLISIVLNFYPLIFILFSLITLKLVFDIINKYSINPVISWLVFYALPLFFFASLSTLRQSLATVIVVYSFKYAIEKKYIKFFISIIIAYMFHSSGIVGVLILPLVILPINKSLNYVLFISSFFLAALTKSVFTTYFSDFSVFERFQEYYLDADTASSTTLQYLYYFIALFNLIFYDKLVNLNVLNKKFIAISTFGVVIFNILSFEPISASRISAFFLMFWIFIFPYYSRLFQTKYEKVIELVLLVLLITLSFYYLNMYIDSYENKIQEKVSFLPYQFWWNNL